MQLRGEPKRGRAIREVGRVRPKRRGLDIKAARRLADAEGLEEARGIRRVAGGIHRERIVGLARAERLAKRGEGYAVNDLSRLAVVPNTLAQIGD
jgi:hypothetical protein